MLGSRQRLEVLGVDARRNFAEVMQVLGRACSVFLRVVPAVRMHQTPIGPNEAMSGRARCELPNPARRLVAAIFLDVARAGAATARPSARVAFQEPHRSALDPPLACVRYGGQGRSSTAPTFTLAHDFFSIY